MLKLYSLIFDNFGFCHVQNSNISGWVSNTEGWLIKYSLISLLRIFSIRAIVLFVSVVAQRWDVPKRQTVHSGPKYRDCNFKEALIKPSNYTRKQCVYRRGLITARAIYIELYSIYGIFKLIRWNCWFICLVHRVVCKLLYINYLFATRKCTLIMRC